MIGAIIGDIIGSTHEFKTAKEYRGPLFPSGSRITDDTVLSIATANCLLKNLDYENEYARFFSLCSFYKNQDYLGLEMGFGPRFVNWAMMNEESRFPYNSFGNGSGMRVSAIGWAFETIEEVISEAEKSASPTHNHPEGIKGACAIASAVFMARKGHERNDIKDFIEDRFGYDLNFDIHELRKNYKFDVTCQGSVPQAIFCALNADDFEQVMRKCLFIGGDTDTIAAMAGSIAEPLYGIPNDIKDKAIGLLIEEEEELKNILDQFTSKYWHETTPLKRMKRKIISKPMRKTNNTHFIVKFIDWIKG
jgi:ADP-ribosylglycohydrolase